jgi:alkylation response protein AidB-like acyl-CoA dehydrogenase
MLKIEPGKPSLEAQLARIRQAAARRDQTGEGLGEEIGWLHEIGLLVAAMPPALCGAPSWSTDPLAVVDMLRRIGAASLPVGRLFEGHLNAAQLIGLYGTPPLQRRCAETVRAGGLLGVWGADGPEPLTARTAANGFVLSGTKAFCSGVGLVEQALVSALVGHATRLFCLDVRDPARFDLAQWQVSGMRATRSGGFDFSGMVVAADAVVGERDVYYAEPWFLGGMYRMCAVQLGGLDELVTQVTAALRLRGKSGDQLAQYRLGQVASLRALANHATAAVARTIAQGAPADEIAREAVLMREGVEHCIVAALDIIERGLGTQLHRENLAVSRLRRDLSFYIRQAAVDDRLIAVGSSLLADDAMAAPCSAAAQGPFVEDGTGPVFRQGLSGLD